MEMFGSHFKVGTSGLEDSATPTVNAAELDMLHQDQMQPFTSINRNHTNEHGL